MGLWGDVSHLLQKQHETVFLVVKSYKMWVSGGGSAHVYISTYICGYMYRDAIMAPVVVLAEDPGPLRLQEIQTSSYGRDRADSDEPPKRKSSRH